jgi:predicted RNA-binding Zn-ribbon protein involved in translation (DUF1610 family)
LRSLYKNMKAKITQAICPKCEGDLTEYPALSREDNKTEICPACGIMEALCSAFFRTRIVKTAGADEFPEAFLASSLERHAKMDWGDVDEEDWQTNNKAARNGGRVVSCYTLRGDRLWIITEADRSVTTLLTPDEY